MSGPLAGTYFTTPGQWRPFVAGRPTGASNTSIGGDGVALQREQSVSEDAVSTQGMVRYEYALTDNVKAHVLGLYSKSEVSITGGFNYFDFAHSIFSGNPFIPADIQARMTSQNIATPSWRA
jgi:hypothetical protein